MPTPQTINEVIQALDNIIDNAIQEQSRIAYFACLYRKMTLAVQQGIADNVFEDGPRMEKLDVIFANRYLEAYGQYKNKLSISRSWEIAFNACEQPYTTIQHLLLGMNAHINLDLGIAAAELCPGEDIHNLRADFRKINDVIGGLINEVQKDIEDICWPMRWVRLINNKEKDAVINFSISLARKGSWANAVALSNTPEAFRSDYIRTLDTKISQVAQNIITPSLSQSILLRVIRLFEPSDISKIIYSLRD